MIIFLAGEAASDLESWLPSVYPARLRAYNEERRKPDRPRHRVMFLDSGAFTFQRTGEVVPLETYAKFVIDYKADIAASMDVIGDAQKTDANFRALRKMGANVVPVVHSNWPTKLIEQYVEENEFILAGGMVPLAKTPEKLHSFLNTIFRTAAKHWPRKVHAFGITGDKLLERYPFYSADSTSWLAYARFGNSLWGGTPLTKFVAKTKPGHGKCKSEVLYIKQRALHLTRLWERRGIVWDDQLSKIAYQFYGDLNVSGREQVQTD